MCDAFAGLGVEVVLRARRGSNASGAATVSEHYGLSHAFRIDDASVLADALWMLRQGLGRIAPRRPATLYYGRKLHTLTRLAGWGCPTGLEVHHPPRNERQAASLRRMIESRGFLGLVVISEALRTELLARCPRLAARDVLVAHDGVRAAHRVEPQLRVTEPLRAVYCGRGDRRTARPGACKRALARCLAARAQPASAARLRHRAGTLWSGGARGEDARAREPGRLDVAAQAV